MTAFTNLTAELWNWGPWLRLEHDPDDVIGRCSKLFWLALYTTHDAKRSPPGLFAGSVTSMAEAARLPSDACVRYLDRLLEHEMVEFDRDYRVLRMTQVPGFGDAYGANAKVIRGWWTSFNRLPVCDVRDAHVETLQWMIDGWRKQKGEPLTAEQSKAWSETFARVQIPPARRRGIRRFVDSDTGTTDQPSLFPVADSPSPFPSEASSIGLTGKGSETVSELFPNPLVPDPDPDPDPFQVRSEAEAAAGGVLDHLLRELGQALGGSWSVGAAQRADLVDQIARLGGLDLVTMGRWLRARYPTNGRVRYMLDTPGELTAVAALVQAWSDGEEISARRAAAMSADLRTELGKVGLGPPTLVVVK